MLYKPEPPFVVHYSGGRTSGYMLWHVLEAYGGKLPSGGLVIFTNTGKERHQTLDHIHEVEQRWNVPIVWLEWESPANGGFKVVTYDNASRNGEPFERLILHKNYLPNPIQRLCTQHLKIATTDAYLRLVLGGEEYTGLVGIRADEPRRWKGRGQDPRNKKRWVEHPLVEAGVFESDIMDWWKEQPFDLQLKQHEGNCDLCFLKSNEKRVRIMADQPHLAQWWIRVEEENRARHSTVTGAGIGFRAGDRKDYKTLFNIAMAGNLQACTNDMDQDLADCNCTD